MAQGRETLEIGQSTFWGTGPNQRTAGHRSSAELRGNFLCKRGKSKVQIPFQVERSLGHELPPTFEKGTDLRFRRQTFCEHNRTQGMKFELEFSHDAKIPPTSAQCPEQIRIF